MLTLVIVGRGHLLCTFVSFSRVTIGLVTYFGEF